MPNYRLALDVGTSSVGLVAVGLDRNLEPTELLYHSSCIFSEPLTQAKKSGVGEPKSAARRKARQARRLVERKARRLRRIAHLAQLFGIDLKSVLSDAGQNIHHLRARAAAERVSLNDLLNILLKLAKRRGYAGEFRVKAKDDELGPVQSGIAALHCAMESAKCATLGAFLAARFEGGESLKLKQVGLYVDRALVEAEFDAIWETQVQFHPVLNSVVEGKPLKTVVHEAIFFQRPLRSPRPMVGACPLESTLSRAPLAQMSAQVFRIEKQIADLRWGNGRSAEPLSSEQKSVIRRLLDEKREVGFEAIYKALEKAGHSKPVMRWLNSSRGDRDALRGNATLAAFRKMGLCDKWNALSPNHQIQVINFLADLGSPEQLNAPDWPSRFTRQGKNGPERRTFTPEMIGFIDEMIQTGNFGRLGAMGFDTGRAAYSIKAMHKLIPLMQEGWDEYHAIREAYPKAQQRSESRLAELPALASTGNKVVDVALRQVRKEVNLAIKHLGSSPTQAIVEMSREMALGIQRRRDIHMENAFNRRQRNKARDDIKAVGLTPSENNIRRYLLWTEQDRSWCPYCNERIGLGDALNGSITNMDHILPRSLTQVGRRRDQLVLAHRRCNDEKLDRTPWEAWGSAPNRWSIVEEHAKQFEKKKLHGKARLLRIRDFERGSLSDKEIDDFADRQFHQTSWIAKLAANWLNSVCKDVAVSRGTMTAFLRRIWKLDTVIPETRLAEGLTVLDTDGSPITQTDFDRYRAYWESHERAAGIERTDRRPDKRIDHRHHLVDALVIALTSRSLYQRMARNYKALAERAARGTRGEKVIMNLSIEPPLKGVRDIASAIVRSPNLRHKPDRFVQGSLFEATAYATFTTQEGKQALVAHVLLSSFADANTTVAAAWQKISDIASPYTHELVAQAFESRVAEGKTAAEALSIPIVYPGYETPIRRVLVKKSGRARVIEHYNRHGVRLHKHLKPDGYAYLELEVKDGAAVLPPHLISPGEAAKRPTTGADSVRRFFKGDTVIDTETGLRYVVRQIKADGGGCMVLTRETEALAADELKGLGGRKQVSGKSLRNLQLVNV